MRGGPRRNRDWFRGIAAAAPEWVRERKRSCRSRPAHASIWAIPTATSTVLAASTAPVVPMHDCGNGSRQLAFAFLSGSRLRLWRAIGPARPRVVRVAQSRRRPIEQDFRSHGSRSSTSVSTQFHASSKPAALSGPNEALASVRMPQSGSVDCDRVADCPSACEGGSHGGWRSRHCCIHEERESRATPMLSERPRIRACSPNERSTRGDVDCVLWAAARRPPLD